MRVHMYMSQNEINKYREGKLVWGVSKEGRAFYPYMDVHVDVDASEVIGINDKTCEYENSTYPFTTFDVRRGEE